MGRTVLPTKGCSCRSFNAQEYKPERYIYRGEKIFVLSNERVSLLLPSDHSIHDFTARET